MVALSMLALAGMIAPREKVALSLGRTAYRTVTSGSSPQNVIQVSQMTFRVRVRNDGSRSVIVNDWNFDLVPA